jgi:hypothetical protein
MAIRGHLKVREAVDLLRVGAALGRLDGEFIEIGPAAAGQEEAGGVISELEVLEVMVVAGEVTAELG